MLLFGYLNLLEWINEKAKSRSPQLSFYAMACTDLSVQRIGCIVTRTRLDSTRLTVTEIVKYIQ